VASFSLLESEKTIRPSEKISIGPSKADFGRFEPFAMAVNLPVALAKNVTT
jgi:hypothetical protein